MTRAESGAPHPDEPPIRISGRLRKRIEQCLRWTCYAYLICLVLILGGTRLLGERYWLTSVAIFAPPQLGLIPAFLLLPGILLLRRKLLWVPLAAVAIIFFGYMTFRLSSKEEPGAKSLSILTNNIGQRKTRTMWPFLRSKAPDVFALQEASNHQKAISSENPDHFVSARGEFLLASRYEITDSGFVPGMMARTGPVAAWFEINFHGTPVVIYNVHMPTPRNDFSRLRGAGFLFELARLGGIYSREGRSTYKQALKKRNELSLNFLEHLQQEKRPFLVVGDFNMPDAGYLYRRYRSELTDAFAAAGGGYGLTFPGISGNPLSLFGPWLRIDYIFASPGWRTLSCQVEPRQPAQHLAVAAEFEFSESKDR